MAASGKKSKKQNWTPVEIEQSVRTTKPSSFDWNAQVEKELSDGYNSKPIELPTAPRASRGTTIDESKLPTSPPFQLYLSNMPFDLREEDLIEFLGDLKIKSVSIPKTDDKGRGKGYGYVELEDKASLIAALMKPDTMIKGRSIKIDLATGNQDGRGMNRGGRGMRDGGRGDMGDDRTMGNWRSRDLDEKPSNYDRSGGGGGGGGGGASSGSSYGGRNDYSSRGFGGRDRQGGFERDDRYGGGDRRENFSRDRDFDRGSNYDDRQNRGFRGGPDRFRDNENRGSNSGQWRDGSGAAAVSSAPSFNRDYERRDFDRDFRFNSRRDDLPPVDKSQSSEGSKTRPKLQLLPRNPTAPPQQEEEKDSPRVSSIFGGAKPVDTAAREKEIEERLMRSDDTHKSGSIDGDSKRKDSSAPPKENAWARKLETVNNNGRTTPESAPLANEDKVETRTYERSKQSQDAPRKQAEESKWGKGPPANMRNSSNPPMEKPKAKEDKPREGKKENADDISKMPKVQETTAPNFAGSNKFSTLLDTEEVE